MINYSFDKSIFYVMFQGIVDYKEIIEYLEEFELIEDLPNNLLLLYDLTNAELNFPANKVEMISEKAEEFTVKYSSIKTAFIVTQPKLAAYTYLFLNHSKELRIRRNVFSGKSSALDWLNE